MNKSNALDRCLWEMHHEGRIQVLERGDRVYEVNGGLFVAYPAEYKIVHKNGGVILRDVGIARAEWRKLINSCLKMEKSAKELAFKDNEVSLF